MDLEWMAWTAPTAVFFIGIGLLLALMTFLGIRYPSVARKGFLPIVTTRGDRLYIGLIGVAFVNLLWLGFTDAGQWIGALLSLAWLLVVLRWG